MTDTGAAATTSDGSTSNGARATEVETQVVINDEQQYSVWPLELEIPEGWSPTGFEGTREECLAHIDVVWTDMRPLSLREQMDA